MTINNLFNNTFYKTNSKPKLFTADIKCNDAVISLPKTEGAILFKFSLNASDLVFFSFQIFSRVWEPDETPRTRF